MALRPRPLTHTVQVAPVEPQPRPLTRPKVELKTKPKSKTAIWNRKLWPAKILNDDLITKMCELIVKGLPFDAVCDYLGLQPEYWYTWVEKGKLAVEMGDEVKPEHEIYAQFYLRTRAASAEYRMKMVEQVHNSKSWLRPLRILERRDRKNWSKTAPDGGTVESFDPDERFL